MAEKKSIFTYPILKERNEKSASNETML